LLFVKIVKSKLDEMMRQAQEGTARARELRSRLQEATALVDGLVAEARSTVKRAIEFLEREGLRAKKDDTPDRDAANGEARRADASAKSGPPREGSPPAE